MSGEEDNLVLRTSLEDLVRSFSVMPDCTIDRVLADAAPQLAQAITAQKYRIAAVDGQSITDSGELKDTLLRLAASGAEAEVTVCFAPAGRHAQKVAIEDSVLSNGARSTMAPAPSERAVKRLLNGLHGSASHSAAAAQVPEAEQPGAQTESGAAAATNALDTALSPQSPLQPATVTAAAAAGGGSTAYEGTSHGVANAAAGLVIRHRGVGTRRPVLAPADTGQASAGGATSATTTTTTTTTAAAAAAAMRGEGAASAKDGSGVASSKSGSSEEEEESSETGSEGSTSEFSSVRIASPTHDEVRRVVAAANAPDLLEFDKMKLSMRTDDVARMLAELPPAAASVKRRLVRALDKVTTGHCVICVVQDFNPVAEIELLAMAAHQRVVSIDLGMKLRLRPRADAFAAQFTEAMRGGAWFVLLNAHKSMSACHLLEELLMDAKGRQYAEFSPAARIIISLEPHPHFPRSLVEGAVVLKLVSSFENSLILSDSMATSTQRTRLVTADTLSASQLSTVPRTPFTPTSAPASAFLPARHVHISAAVDIVDIPAREVLNAEAAGRRAGPIDVSGSVALIKTFAGVPSDKFLCVHLAGEAGRFAVGSSLGNLYFLDGLGNSLLQAHAHNAAIWDVAFADKLHFATGCEDGNAATWQLASQGDAEDATLTPTSATSLGNDVYCVAFARSVSPAPLVIGGLNNHLVIRVGQEQTVQLVPISSNAQVIACLPSRPLALVGSGDGTVGVVDLTRAAALATLSEHTRKVPALTVRTDTHFFTGAFDSTILSWDLRQPGGVTGEVGVAGDNMVSAPLAHTMHTLKLKNYVTGLSVDDIHLAATVGENLYLWDVRNLNTVLGGYPQGWKGLTRGIVVQSADHTIVTASQDGRVRFWTFV